MKTERPQIMSDRLKGGAVVNMGCKAASSCRENVGTFKHIQT